jgi:cytosine/adenosine deaminase-related metal-dependent hydrolase
VSGNKGSILIKNGLIITMDSLHRILKGNIYIEEGILKEIGSTRLSADKVIDADGKMVSPGFIQTHIHLCQVLFRGLADDMDVVDWLKQRIWLFESAHDEDSINASAYLGIAELIAGGTTTALSMETTRFTDGVFEAALDSGFRGFCGNAMMDVVEPGTDMRGMNTAQSIAESKRLFNAWNGKGNGRLHYAIMPRGARNCSPELVSLSHAFAKDNGLLMHTHVSENGPLSERLKRETGMGDIELLFHQGVTDEKLVVAHAIWLNEEEIDLVKQTGVKIAHCPSANMKLSSGFCKVPEMLEMGIDISLGADGAPCNNNLDMFHEMRLASLIHKPRCGPTSMKAYEVLKMATIGGARCLGIDGEVGSLEVGKKADVILLNRNELHCSPSVGVAVDSQIVYSLKSTDVDTTIIDGIVLYENKRFTKLDKEKILNTAAIQAEKTLNRVPFGKRLIKTLSY